MTEAHRLVECYVDTTAVDGVSLVIATGQVPGTSARTAPDEAGRGRTRPEPDRSDRIGTTASYLPLPAPGSFLGSGDPSAPSGGSEPTASRATAPPPAGAEGRADLRPTSPSR